MKQVSIQIPFDDEKLEALKIFLSQKDQTAEAVIGELVDLSLIHISEPTRPY